MQYTPGITSLRTRSINLAISASSATAASHTWGGAGPNNWRSFQLFLIFCFFSIETKKAQEWQNLLVTELKLTDDQQKKIAEMNKAFAERLQGMENNPNYTEEFKAERRIAIKKSWEAQFLKLLTPEQQARYKELLEAKTK